MIKKLIKFGLKEAEATIYLEILEVGQTTGGDLIKKTKMHRMVVYTALKELENKKLIVSNKKRGVYYFSANAAESLTDYLKKQKETANIIKDSIKKLRELPPPPKDKPNVEVYEGIEGFDNFLKKIIKETPKNESIYFFDTLGVDCYDKFKHMYYNYNRKRESKKIMRKVIKTEAVNPEKKYAISKFKYNEERVLPKNKKTIIPFTFNVFSKYVAFELDIGKYYTVIVEDKELHDNFKAIFESLWKASIKK